MERMRKPPQLQYTWREEPVALIGRAEYIAELELGEYEHVEEMRVRNGLWSFYAARDGLQTPSPHFSP